jgi:hypothetical protein
VSGAKQIPLPKWSKFIGLLVLINEAADARAHTGVTCIPHSKSQSGS